MTLRDIPGLVTAALDKWNKDNVPRLGAALAYYTVLSMAPLLVVVVAVAGLAFGKEAARGQIVWQIQGLAGYQVAEAIQGILQGAQRPGNGIIATVAGVVTLVLGASLVVSELRSSLNLIWKAPCPSERGVLRELLTLLQYRFGSFLIVLGAGVRRGASLGMSTSCCAAGRNLHGWSAAGSTVIQVRY